MAASGLQLVIFDCDGVLVDSESISVDVLRETVTEAGGDIGEDEAYGRFLGRSTAAVAQILENEFDLSIGPGDLETMRRRLFARFEAELQPIAGVAEVLDGLDVPVCVASSSQPDRIRLSLRLTGLLERFDPNIFSSSMVRSGKPAPDLFLHAAAAMGVNPANCIVIEDSPAGVEAAKRAGMQAFAFLGGAHFSPGLLREAIVALAPDAVFDDMRELPRLLAEHMGRRSQTRGAKPAAKPRIAGGDHRRDLVCAVDVGTLSTRAGIFDADGVMLSRAEQPIELRRPVDGLAEHDSEDIWSATCTAVHLAREEAGVAASRIAGIGFDATCSLVIRDADGAQLPVSESGESRFDTIAWLDHRALVEAGELTASGHRVLDFVGGIMSPEMQTPKLLWLKRHMQETWRRAGYFFDLSDFLTWRATGNATRSQCTLTAKWTYLSHEEGGGWQEDFLAGVGLGDMVTKGRLPETATPVDRPSGTLTAEAAEALGLDTECVAATGMIDAFAGALGSIGGLDRDEIEKNAALIAGTSSCIMGISHEALPAPGIWGPYYGAALPDKWVWEGGQSATGGLLDHIITLFGQGRKPDAQTHRDIIRRIGELRAEEGESFAGDIHVLPDFHGNRSPFANPNAKGIIAGLTLDHSFDNLARIYWRTALGIALGVRQIVDHLNDHGRRIETLHIVGGHRWNPLLMELYAEATGLEVCEPRTGDAVLLGTAMLAASASGLHPDLATACAAMASERTIRRPRGNSGHAYESDYEMFKNLQKLYCG